MKILILDDHECEVELIHYQLQKDYEDAEIVATTDIEVAMGYLDSNAVDIAVVDIQMPLINGKDFVSMHNGQIHSVVYMTANEYDVDTIEPSLQRDRVLKPIKSNVIKENIDRLVANYKKLVSIERLLLGNKRYEARYASR